MSSAYIGIGSNLGDRQKNIEAALEKLRGRKGVEIKEVSSVIETEPVGNTDQPKFLNAAFRIETTLYPDELLDALKSIERELGRDKDSAKKRISVEEQLKMLQEGASISPPEKSTDEPAGEDEAKRWGPRTIDLDILFYDDVMMKGNNLIIPHPLLHERYFALKPLSEIAPEAIHPVLKKSVKELLLALEGDGSADETHQEPTEDAGGLQEIQEGE